MKGKIERTVRSHASVAAVAAALVAVSGSSVAAQVVAPERAQNSVAVSFIQARPVGALGGNIGFGYGGSAALLVPVDRRGLLSLRADAGVAEYGHEETRTAFSETVGGRVDVSVRTSNAVVPFHIGLELSPDLGVVLPYVNGGIGGQAFYTESSVQPLDGGVPLASTVNQWDVAFAWVAGGGLYVPVSSGAHNVMLDISAQYVRGGTAQYLAPGSIVDGPGGAIVITRMESQTHIVVMRLGARIAL
jgi:opacity protein-like surface antigen